MKSLVIFRNVFVAAALVAVPAACKDDGVRGAADNAAERVGDQREELREARQDLAEEVSEQREDLAEGQRDDRIAGLPENAGDRLAHQRVDDDRREAREEIAEEARDVNEQAIEVAQAVDRFETQRQHRIVELRSVHGVVASQPMLINAVAGMAPLTDRARAELNEKMHVFQMRIDEAGNMIEVLQGADPETFEARNDEAETAKDRLEEAREAAWEALSDGDRIEAS